MSHGHPDQIEELDPPVGEDDLAELKRSNAELAAFARTVAHDLGEPLRTVSGFIELLADRYGDRLDPEGRDYLAHALEGAENMRGLLDGLLAHSLIGEAPTEVAQTELSVAADRAIAALHGQIDDAHGELVVGNLPSVRIDPIQAEQLFLNLISNALKFRAERPPRIEISADRSAEGTTIAVADNGIGIDPADRERIFEMFERASDEPGAGIGLAICARIAQSHDGRIWVEETPGGGSTFKVRIPANE